MNFLKYTRNTGMHLKQETQSSLDIGNIIVRLYRYMNTRSFLPSILNNVKKYQIYNNIQYFTYRFL